MELRRKYGCISIYNYVVALKIEELETTDEEPAFALSYSPPIAFDAKSTRQSVSARELVFAIMLLSLRDGEMEVVPLRSRKEQGNHLIETRKLKPKVACDLGALAAMIPHVK